MTLSPLQDQRAAIAAAIVAHTDVDNCDPTPRTTRSGVTALLIPVPSEDRVMGAGAVFDLDVVLLVPQTRERWGETLDEFLFGERSLEAALDTDRAAIRSTGIDVVVDGWQAYGQVEWGGKDFWSVTVRLSVL